MSVVALLFAPILTGSLFAQSAEDYQSSVSSNYNYAFGEASPFLPSQAVTSSGKFIQSTQFASAQYCSQCHEDAHRQWRQSAHANSFRAPFYVKSVDLLIKEKGIEYTRHCEGCHNPIALFSGALTPNSKADRSFDEDGITCSVCHSIEKIQDTGGTGSYVMGIPSALVAPDGTRIPGEASYDKILAHPVRHKKAVMQDFYRSPEFCAVCHKASLPRILNGYKWLRAFSVYDEWQQSSWSMETPLPFYKKDSASTCQTCHMPSSESTEDYGAKGGKLKSHRFLGANTAIPTFYGYQEQLDKVEEFLRDAVAIDIFGIQKDLPRRKADISVLGNNHFDLRAGETVTVSLVIQNRKIGHSLVPEQRDFYECWVEFVATDANGAVLYHSGYLEPNGYLEEGAHSYTNRLLSASGKLLDLHQVWDAKVKGYDNTILPGRSDLVRYQFRIPPDSKGPITVSAKVNYRRFRRGYTDFVLQPPRDFPVSQIALQTACLRLAANGSDAVVDRKALVQRWNNYGIALLGQYQYQEAQQAFQRVTELDPAYADGYINVALVQYSQLIENKKEPPDGVGNLSYSNQEYEKFVPALRLLGQALKINPDSARALYYQGLIFRQQKNFAGAIADQKRVISIFPRFRQGRQELGYLYYLTRDFKSALEQFEQVQAINPDDLTAHYYLSLICERLGMQDRAQVEGARFAEQRDDPTAGALAQAFWRTHPTVVDELAPYHIHESSSRRHPVTVGGPLP